LHEKWHSSEYETRQNSSATTPEDTPVKHSDAVSEQLRELAAKYAKPRDGDAKP
jgi:hypothetical protein